MRLVGAACILVLLSACGEDAAVTTDEPDTESDAGTPERDATPDVTTTPAPVPTNGVKNGDETDVDCGGRSAPPCGDGKACAIPSDCASQVCTGFLCQPPAFDDNVKNGDETGIDCGGSAPGKCAVGGSCRIGADCKEGVCAVATNTCSPPTDADAVKNGDETGVDCGGPTSAKKCAPGQGCAVTADCDNTLCNAGKSCDAPSKEDGLKNGTETDVDCGGAAPTSADRCAEGKVCDADGDCGSGVCSYAKRCAPAPSCRVHEGGDTCGALEVEDPGRAHESCCASVKLPNRNVKIDKYEITAGRMREFIRATGNNVQKWIADNPTRATNLDANLTKFLPTGLNSPTQRIWQCNDDGSGCAERNQTFGVYSHLGNTVFMPDRPCPNCGQGCWVNTGQYQNGHPTYWWDGDTQTEQFGAAPRAYSREQLDVKSLNCVTQVLLAAFCAWDGGRLPTQDELGGTAGAWGPDAQPWGNAPDYLNTWTTAVPDRRAYGAGFDNGSNIFLVPMAVAGENQSATRRFGAYTDNTANFNPFPISPSFFSARYVYPFPVNAQGRVLSATNDQAYAVAPPGRMRRDFRKIGPGDDDGFYDVRANLMEITANYRASDDATHNGWPIVAWVGASFEGHQDGRDAQFKSVFTKYGKQGGRCARDLPQ